MLPYGVLGQLAATLHQKVMYCTVLSQEATTCINEAGPINELLPCWHDFLDTDSFAGNEESAHLPVDWPALLTAWMWQIGFV